MATYKQYQNKNGDVLWQVRGYLGIDALTGKEKTISRQGFKTKKEARQAYRKAVTDFENGSFKVKNKRITLTELYHEWLDNVYKDSVKESTLNKTEQYFRLHILPAFGSMYIDKISANLIQKQVNKWHKEFAQWKKLYNYLTKLLDYAVMQDYIQSNPKEKVSIKKKKINYSNKEPRLKFYTKEQLKTLLDHIKSTNNMRWYCYFRLIAFSGMRKGECLALNWQDVNFKEGTVTIDKTLTLGRNNKLMFSSSPKTFAGNRTIVLDEVTLNVLRDWKKEQAVIMLKYGFNTLKPNQLLFSNYKTNKPLSLSAPYNRMITYTKNCNLPMLPVHGLRHTHCSLLIESQVSLKEVMNRLGHNDVETTIKIYTHISERQERESAQKFASHVGF